MRITLGKKLGFGFAVVLALQFFSSTMSFWKSASIKQSQDTTFDVRYPTLETCRRLQRDLNQAESKGREFILASTQAPKREAVRNDFDGTWSLIIEDLARLDELAPRFALQINRERLEQVKKVLPTLRGAQESAMTDALLPGREAAVKAGDEFAEQATPANESIK